nr:hypothetical protein Q903MT_gene1175 [Picea sitchensis]
MNQLITSLFLVQVCDWLAWDFTRWKTDSKVRFEYCTHSTGLFILHGLEGKSPGTHPGGMPTHAGRLGFALFRLSLGEAGSCLGGYRC